MNIEVLAWALGIILVLLPVFFMLYLNIGGIYEAIKKRTVRPVCKLDADCPPGYICDDGTCVPDPTLSG